GFEAQGWVPILADVIEPAGIAAAPAMDAMLYAVGFDRSAGVPKRRVSVDGFFGVLEAVSGRCPRVVAISSSSVYGQSGGEIVDERSPTEPVTESGQICLEAEQVLWDWRGSQPASAVACVVRLAGLYGPGR